jgi:hypothetical protein
MAELRLIGEPDEVRAILEAIGTVVHTADLRTRAARDPGLVRVYGHTAPLAATGAAPAVTVTVERVERDGGRGRDVGRDRWRELPPGGARGR